MKRITLTLMILLAAALACGQGNYYDAVIDLTGQELYTALHALISTNTYSSYDGAKVFLFQQLDNHNGYVTCIYTGYEHYVGYDYYGSSDPNTEHTYAQSWFSSSESTRKKADLHHLFPSTMQVNSSRGNYPLFTVANHAAADVYYNDTPWQSFRGLSSNGYTVFEPADESKGNIARALLYFNTRYYDSLTQQNVNMIPDLAQWHYDDPPDAAEIARNSAIQGFQTNRNPFIDHPEFVGRIWGGSPVQDESVVPGAELRLEQVWPNPFSDSTTLAVQSKEALQAKVCVYDVKGRQVKAWEQNLPRGSSEISWNGRDERGLKAAPGVYLIQVRTAGQSLSAKVLLN
ncbi:MAG: endonuclease [Candidatus Cloacimonetes bacterium]|nr:endonuclease [Candidatus Cloacimonadota bacterium]